MAIRATDPGYEVIDHHLAAENAHDVEATLATYTDDIVWDDVTNPECPLRGQEATRRAYDGILQAIPDIHLESVWRHESGSVVVDEAIVTGHVEGTFAGVDGGGAPVEFRLLHVFELRNGLISRENAWFDSAVVQRQVHDFKRGTR